jgi:hypothetical protein
MSALLALLTASIPALADSLSAVDLPACCNTSYCPVHHRQTREMQTDKSLCDTHSKTGATNSSMRACDDTPHQAIGSAPFTLTAPVRIFYEATAQAAPSSQAGFFPFVISLPSTPPPRALSS